MTELWGSDLRADDASLRGLHMECQIRVRGWAHGLHQAPKGERGTYCYSRLAPGVTSCLVLLSDRTHPRFHERRTTKDHIIFLQGGGGFVFISMG